MDPLVFTMNLEFGLTVARALTDATDDDWPQCFERLRREKQLSVAIKQINAMLELPEHRKMAMAALKRIGLWHE